MPVPPDGRHRPFQKAEQTMATDQSNTTAGGIQSAQNTVPHGPTMGVNPSRSGLLPSLVHGGPCSGRIEFRPPLYCSDLLPLSVPLSGMAGVGHPVGPACTPVPVIFVVSMYPTHFRITNRCFPPLG